jgi:hypothetical protein
MHIKPTRLIEVRIGSPGRGPMMAIVIFECAETRPPLGTLRGIEMPANKKLSSRILVRGPSSAARTVATLSQCGRCRIMPAANETVQSRKCVTAIMQACSICQRTVWNLFAVFISKSNFAWLDKWISTSRRAQTQFKTLPPNPSAPPARSRPRARWRRWFSD